MSLSELQQHRPFLDQSRSSSQARKPKDIINALKNDVLTTQSGEVAASKIDQLLTHAFGTDATLARLAITALGKLSEKDAIQTQVVKAIADYGKNMLHISNPEVFGENTPLNRQFKRYQTLVKSSSDLKKAITAKAEKRLYVDRGRNLMLHAYTVTATHTNYVLETVLERGRDGRTLKVALRQKDALLKGAPVNGEMSIAGGATDYGTFIKSHATIREMHGEGKSVWDDQTTIIGTFDHGHPTQGIIIASPQNPHFIRYEGPFEKHAPVYGKGRVTLRDESIVTWDPNQRNDVGPINYPHGVGTIEYPNGDVYEGQLYTTVPHGDGKMTAKGSDTPVIGKWENGQLLPES